MGDHRDQLTTKTPTLASVFQHDSTSNVMARTSPHAHLTLRTMLSYLITAYSQHQELS